MSAERGCVVVGFIWWRSSGTDGGLIWGWYSGVCDINGCFPIWAGRSWGDLGGAGWWARVGIRGAAFTSWIWVLVWGLYGEL